MSKLMFNIYFDNSKPSPEDHYGVKIFAVTLVHETHKFIFSLWFAGVIKIVFSLLHIIFVI